ncbi:MAG: hypothetical protein R3362_01655 [Rhodothermales bacterium]|nr:hypothetical protein [Rhodothermales bacterium]
MRLPILLLAAVAFAGLAPAPSPAACTDPAARQLDFWTGEWALTWEAQDGPGRGTNTITQSLDGCVIHERFAAENGFEGMSVSVYDARSQQWRQTWVDNRGGYLLFTGGLHGGQMELRTAPFANPQGQEQISRMIWQDVTADALTWHWQRSLDDGATWQDLWVIRYARR